MCKRKLKYGLNLCFKYARKLWFLIRFIDGVVTIR